VSSRGPRPRTRRPGAFPPDLSVLAAEFLQFLQDSDDDHARLYGSCAW
jgi:hypothetical protein